jgi:glycosyltransferase involved in cell wall biosynthesis
VAQGVALRLLSDGMGEPMTAPGDVRNTEPLLVSVVIPTYNRARHLARALEALELQTIGADAFEVIVVDDGSTDDTAATLARDWDLGLQTLHQPNQGPGAARNAGIAIATGRVVLFVDDDVIPAPDLIELHLRAHGEPGRAVIGRMVAPTVRQPFWAEWEMRTLERQYEMMVAAIFEPTPRQFYTANASVRRDDLLRAGLFDPRYRRAEDVELAFRLEEAGLRFVFESEAHVLHDTPRPFAAWMRMAEQYGYYDVLLSRQGGKRWITDIIADEFAHDRHGVVRAAARLTIGYRWRMAAVRALAPLCMRAADALRLRRLAMAGCSVLFNLLYWHAFCHEFGGRRTFWDAIAAPAPRTLPAEAAE